MLPAPIDSSAPAPTPPNAPPTSSGHANPSKLEVRALPLVGLLKVIEGYLAACATLPLTGGVTLVHVAPSSVE